MTSIHITSDIGRLKKVLLHQPGKELLNLTPDTLQDLLFDDIPFLEVAIEEHKKFAEVLRKNGVEVLYLENLVTEVLDSNEEIKRKFIKQFIEETSISNDNDRLLLENYLLNIQDNKLLVEKTMSGIQRKEIVPPSPTNEFLAAPMPNLYFTRDNFACIENGVSINHMYSKTRRRETIYGDYIFKYHPMYCNVPKYYNRDNKWHIEGGDICVLNNHTLIIGLSERTQEEAIIDLSKTIFQSPDSNINTILIFSIFKKRAYMHLDTVFTQVDKNAFVYHPGIMGNLKILKITKETPQVQEISNSLEKVLEEHVGMEVKLIPCAGGDPIAAAREQWSDGPNTLCIKPGVVIVYNRNPLTNQQLKQAGVEVLEIPSAELSRGRGGPRCMSMPLVREDVEW